MPVFEETGYRPQAGRGLHHKVGDEISELE